jgi:putative hydrolase of the HAD superfamily
MKKPKMIIFDCGQTLLGEPEHNSLHGEEALFKYIKTNKNNLTPRQVNDFSQKLFEKTRAVRNVGMELHEWQFEKLLYEYLEIEFSITLPEAEKVFWENTAAGVVMPNADKLIDYINKNNMRSGVISNSCFSGNALSDRLNRLLPQNKFEFVIASSEYTIRKPNSMLFELALKKANLDAGNVWFCGDNVKADVEGSAAVGIFPVWYEDETIADPYREDVRYAAPQCEHLHIHDWNELIEALEN